MRRAPLLLSLTLLACGGKGVPGDDAADVAGVAAAAPMDLSGPIVVPTAIPADAGVVIAGRVDRPLFDTWLATDLTGTRDLAEAQATVKELDDFVHARLGIRVAKMQGISAFVRGQGGAAIVSGVSGKPTLDPDGDHGGTPLYKFEGKLTLAIVDDMLVVGTDDAVRGAIDAAKGTTPPFSAAADELSKAWQAKTPGAWIAVAVSADQIKDERDFRPVTKAGVEAGLATVGPTGWSASVFGDPSKMTILADQARGALALAITAAEGAKSEALKGDDVMVGVGAIMGVQAARDAKRALKIETKERELTLSMPIQTGQLQGAAMLVPVAGILAAIAIPALSKYMRRAKTSEARAQLAKMFDATAAFFQEEHVDRGMVDVIGTEPQMPTIAPHRCPMYAGKPVGSTPLTPPIGTDCSAGPGGRCVPGGTGPGGYDMKLWSDDDVWNSLNFMQEQAHYFHYKYTYSNDTTAYGACQFTVQAFGDLDGDGEFSTYERSGAADRNGVNAAAGLFIDKEVE